MKVTFFLRDDKKIIKKSLNWTAKDIITLVKGEFIHLTDEGRVIPMNSILYIDYKEDSEPEPVKNKSWIQKLTGR